MPMPAGGGGVTGLGPGRVSLAVLLSAPAGVQAAKPRPQHTLPFYPYRYNLPSARYGHAMAAVADGSVVVFGGESEGHVKCDELLKLDLHERQWHAVTTPGPQPSGRIGHAMAAVASGTRLVVFGGSTDSGAVLDELWIFNVLNPVWVQLTAGASGAWPRARDNHAMATVSDTHVLLFGGWTYSSGSGRRSDELWSLDVPGTSWTRLTAGSSPGGAECEDLPGKLSLTTWYDGTNGCEVYVHNDGWCDLYGDADYNGEGRAKDQCCGCGGGDEKDQPGAWPSARNGHEMVTVSDTRVLLFGGYTDSGRSDDLFSLDFLAAANHTVRWTRLNDESVTVEELREQFNNGQVGGCCVGVSVEDSLS